MKEYSVKQVVRMENKLQKFTSNTSYEDFLLPALIMFCVGGSIATVALNPQLNGGAANTDVSVITGAAMAALGSVKTARILFHEHISDRMYNKLEKIYAEQGEDFESAVKMEREKSESKSR